MPLTTPELEAKWNTFSSIFQRINEPFTLPLASLLIASIHVSSGRAILEVGCGAGASTSWCSQVKSPESTLHAIDLSSAMIQLAKERIDKIGQDARVTLDTGDAEKLSQFSDGQFDRYFSNFCLHLVNSPEAMLKQAHRVLQKGSFASWSVWGRAENSPWITVVSQALTELNIEFPGANGVSPSFHLGDIVRLKQMVAAAGFTRVVAWYHPSPYIVADADQYVEWGLSSPMHVDLLKSLKEDIRTKFKTRVRVLADEYLARGDPLAIEALVVVAQKE